MSNVPYYLPKARQGFRMGHQRAVDGMMFDALEDAFEPGTPSEALYPTRVMLLTQAC